MRNFITLLNSNFSYKFNTLPLICFGFLSLILVFIFSFSTPLKAQTTSEAWLYGKVTTWDGDTYEGQLRWGKEEAYWTDMFNASKIDNENLDYLDRDIKRELADSRSWHHNHKWNGWVSRSININNYDFTHQFSVQFGHIQQIKRKNSSKVLVTMRDGKQIKLSGSGYNDVGAKVRVYDPKIGKIELDWSDVETVDFMATPKNLKSEIGEPLFGKVESWVGTYEGYIIWDKDERVTSDKLDGETRDADMSIDFGNIVTIEQKGNKSEVTLKSGKSYRMGDSNDVDNGNRGVIVVMPGKGRIVIDWDDFDKVTFTKAPNVEMKTYNSFSQPTKLYGTVTTDNGKSYTGNLVYDLDEAYTYEILDGSIKDTEFEIPFGIIKSIQPRGNDESMVILKSGEKYELDESQDVTEKNTGILVFEKDKSNPIYIYWEDVEKVEFK